MKILQLRNHIPIAGPARREPADGAEPPLRVSLGFEPAWFRQRCNVEFSARWHTDPHYRHDTLRCMKAELLRAFPAATCWNAADDRDLATISGCYGAYPIPHACGRALRYAPDRWPALTGPYLTRAEIERLSVDAVLDSPVVADLFRQMEIIEREWGQIHGYLNWQGVLNNAFNLRGQAIFTDMTDAPDFAQHCFALMADIMIALARRVQARQRASGFAINQFSISNCVMNMISPRMYQRFLLPRDARIAAGFERFGVHTCNWNVTPYLRVLGQLPKVGYLDMGMDSEFVKVKAAFPDTRRAVLYSPVNVQDAPLADLRRDMQRIARELAPCDVVLADLQAHTPDARVNAFLDLCQSGAVLSQITP